VYLWLHPIFDYLNLRPTQIQTPQVFITHDFQHWQTGSVVKDLPSNVELDPNANVVYVLPWEDIPQTDM
jgi:hypothetical protein